MLPRTRTSNLCVEIYQGLTDPRSPGSRRRFRARTERGVEREDCALQRAHGACEVLDRRTIG